MNLWVVVVGGIVVLAMVAISAWGCGSYAVLLSLIAWRKLMRGPVRRIECA